MTLRIILSVRGSLIMGGTFALSASAGESSRSAQTASGRSNNAIINSSAQPNTFTLDDLQTKPEREWQLPDSKSSIHISDRKNDLAPDSREPIETTMAVKSI
jgi:hypothetical protein